MNDIQFTKEDIVNNLEEMIRKGPIDGKKAVSELAHEIKNFNGGIEGFTDLVLENCDELNIHQKAHINNINNISRILTYSISNISQMVTDRINLGTQTPNSIEQTKDLTDKIAHVDNQISTRSTNILKDIKKLREYSPLLPNIKGLGRVENDATRYVEILDRQIDNLIYLYNLQLAPDFQREEYYPAVEIKKYCDSYKNNDGKIQAKIHNGRNIDATIKGKENNILKNAIIPLHNNVEKHAYKGKDMYGRSSDPEFEKEIEIGSHADLENKVIIYHVTDNGFGISPKVRDTLLTKEGITSKDNEDDTGIGLWAVKTFVESMGGKLWFESELGKSTTFYFTVPYDRKTTNDIYITEPCKNQPKN